MRCSIPFQTTPFSQLLIATSNPRTTAMERKDILLRAAYDLIIRNDGFYHVKSAGETLIHYDDSDCDGLCLAVDIANELGLDLNEQPIPLQD